MALNVCSAVNSHRLNRLCFVHDNDAKFFTVKYISCSSCARPLFQRENCVIIAGLEVYVLEQLKFGTDKRVVNNSLYVFFVCFNSK